MVGYEMLAQAQRDLTAEQVSNELNVGSESGYDIYSVFTGQIETLTCIRLRETFRLHAQQVWYVNRVFSHDVKAAILVSQTNPWELNSF